MVSVKNIYLLTLYYSIDIKTFNYLVFTSSNKETTNIQSITRRWKKPLVTYPGYDTMRCFDLPTQWSIYIIYIKELLMLWFYCTIIFSKNTIWDKILVYEIVTNSQNSWNHTIVLCIYSEIVCMHMIPLKPALHLLIICSRVTVLLIKSQAFNA